MSLIVDTALAFVAFWAFLGFLLVLGIVIPGKVQHGTTLNDGSKLSYKCNGLNILLFLLPFCYVCTKIGLFPATILVDYFVPVCLAVNIFAIGLTFWLYYKGHRDGAKPSGSLYHDFVMGMELNPRALGVDIKLFSLRPAMMGWLLINLSFLAKQAELGPITMPMMLYQFFTAFYIFDYFYFEPLMTSTWDIVAEHYGLMLVWGDYVFIPFAFSIQNWVLYKGTTISPLTTILSVVFFVCGYIVFRFTNKQKHDFKHNPKTPIWGKPPKVIAGRLLCSGFWAFSRHMNYFGDLMLAVSYALPCGFSWETLPGWVYPTYLLILLIHRERRDEARCAKKYGDVWKQYTKEVPYRIVPYIY